MAESNTNPGSLSTVRRSRATVAMQVQPVGETVEDVLSLRHYIWLLRRSLWKIVLVVVVCTALVTLYCFTVKPVYQATARVTIDPRISSAVVGEDAQPAGASDVDQVINTEMQMMQSDAVLRPVAEQFNLLAPADLHTAPRGGGSFAAKIRSALRRLPWVGRHANNGSPTDAPVVLSGLTVTHPSDSLLVDISYRSNDPRQAALVANAIAQSYIAHALETRARSSMSLSAFMEKQIAELKENMDDSALALRTYEQKLGVINPGDKTSMVAARIMQLQNEYTEAQNDRIQKETEYRALLSGSSTAALDISPQATQLGRQEEEVRAAEEKLAVTKTLYGPNYAEYKRATNDLAEVTRQYQQMRTDVSKRIQVAYQEALNHEHLLQASLVAAKDESDKLNASSAQYEELKREAEANKSLYDELYRKIKEAGVNAGFQGSSIRIANEARPPYFPVFPQKGLLISLAFFLSAFGSYLLAVLADMLDNTLRDPEQARRFSGCEVLATLPRVRSFPKEITALESEKEYARSVRGSRSQQYFETEAFYRESISILLSTIMHHRSSRSPRSLLITSTGSGDGKSSCAAHLALAHANTGKRTLLIDADLRNPFQHEFFHLDNSEGLGTAITRKLPLRDISQSVAGFESFDVLVAGLAPRHSFSKVGRTVDDLLQQAQTGYDLIIIDAPPMVGLSDPVDIACVADGTLIIGHAARTSRQSLAEVVATLDRVGANVLGVVLNHVRLSMSESYRQYAEYASYAGRLVEASTSAPR